MSGIDPVILANQLEAARQQRIVTAREDVNVFAALVLRDERSGQRIRQSQVHREMHALLDASPRTVLWGFVESGKSEQVIVARIIHALGRDPSLRVGIVGATIKSASKLLKKIANLIATSDDVRAVFPHLRPATPWNETAITVIRKTSARDPSVQAIGLHSGVLGSRLDIVAMDDVVTQENAKSPARRKDVQEWILGTLFGRLTADSRVWMVGNAFHPDDAMHHLEKLPGWLGKRFPVLDPQTGESVWPERWPMDRVQKRRSDIGPLEFARTMLCQPRSDDDARFKRADVEACIALGKGLGVALPHSMESWRKELAMEHKRRCRFYTGVDLAVQLHAAADISAIFTIAVHPDGVREVIGLESGRWPAHEIIKRIAAVQKRWDSLVVIENVAAQEWMRQFVNELGGVNAVPYTTGKGKASLEFQAEGLSSEVTNHRWVIPCGAAGELNPEVSEWVQALLYYNPSAHTPDRMAAGLFARWLALRGDAVGAGGPSMAVLGGGGDPWGGAGGGGGCWG